MKVRTDSLGHHEILDDHECGDWFNPLTWFEDPKIRAARVDAKANEIKSRSFDRDFKRRSENTSNAQANMMKSLSTAMRR